MLLLEDETELSKRKGGFRLDLKVLDVVGEQLVE